MTSNPAETRSTVTSVLLASAIENEVRMVTVKMTSENIPSSIEVRNRRASG